MTLPRLWLLDSSWDSPSIPARYFSTSPSDSAMRRIPQAVRILLHYGMDEPMRFILAFE